MGKNEEENVMLQEVYDLIDWREVEAVVYSDEDKPHSILGPHACEQGTLVHTFLPDATSVKVIVDGKKKEFEMEKVDDAGFFSALLPMKEIEAYHYEVAYGETVVEMDDPYRFPLQLKSEDLDLFEKGIHYSVYEILGAHVKTIDGVTGVLFAVWAPNAVRVSVVGDFNMWDGRRHPMERHDRYGVFELFIPGLTQGAIYKYEIKVKGDMPILKADPYASAAELRPANASVVFDSSAYVWNDAAWLTKRDAEVGKNKPMSIYEVQIGSFKKPEEDKESFYNYRELAVMIAKYVKEMGYTHIELMPVTEYPYDGSWGYQVTGYYAPTARYGTPEDFKYFIDYMHQNQIGVILDWVPAHFPRDAFGLATFDGTCLYEHLDPRQGSHPHWGTLIYNYGRPQVSNFLIANAMYWAEQFHVDGIRMDAVASMLYLDYGKQHGEWVANEHGGNENLEAIELLKHLNSMMKKRNPSVMMIAEESTAWPMVSSKVEDGGLGFDFKWNMGWMNDFLNYMKMDPFFRKGFHGALTFSMMYAYSEHFVLVLSHDEVVHGKGSMIGKMPGTYEEKFANLRAAYGFMMMHPGKKLLFMGQEFGQFAEWSEEKSLDWNLVEEYENHRNMQKWYKTLNHFYTSNPALYELDDSWDGFEWINCSDAENSVVSFVRKSKKPEETLLVVCNFTPVMREDYGVGVPFEGKYKEILNSDWVEFGGATEGAARVKKSEAIAWDDRENSIKVTLPPLSVQVYSCTPAKPKKASTKTKAKKEAVVEVETVEEGKVEPVAEEKPKKKAGRPKKSEAKVEETVVEVEAVETDAKEVAVEEVKDEAVAEEKPKKKAGRPKKSEAKVEEVAVEVETVEEAKVEPVAEEKPKKKAGRPKKSEAKVEAAEEAKVEPAAEEKPKRKAGRPKKSEAEK